MLMRPADTPGPVMMLKSPFSARILSTAGRAASSASSVTVRVVHALPGAPGGSTGVLAGDAVAVGADAAATGNAAATGAAADPDGLVWAAPRSGDASGTHIMAMPVSVSRTFMRRECLK